ncbi:DNA-protecting protein DprA [Patescibacteria group bacterium]|nr:DNA-protecting protein DprA [Patescibacteria group bacterium]MBU1472584.1 DNA-protecting protein DprA [Patescibacteria group bacterium]MBU2459835.1 DNA-protecting protein DprA [Patescibacteria group bacterium]MBU2544104.1 DNA-protecting protein DprA [Patescibacteria group bacterium]
MHALLDLKDVPQLADLPNPPGQLFFIGKPHKQLFQNCVSIVGSRQITEYGKRVIELLVPKLVFEKKVIISGFMRGVDQYAHRACVENGGKTIAVLGWGIDTILSPEDKKLADDIVSHGGILLSEWQTQRSTLWTFPVRNRIVAALAQEVYIIEAGLKSGSLITANWAIKLKRKLFAVPGSVTSRVSEGTNMLIANGLAKMWCGIQQPTQKSSDDPILHALEQEPLTINQLSRNLNKPIAELGASLSLLLLSGQLVERDGVYYKK